MSVSVSELTWEQLVQKIGVSEANKELDKRTKEIFDTLKDLTSVYNNDNSLQERVKVLKPVWFVWPIQKNRCPPCSVDWEH